MIKVVYFDLGGVIFSDFFSGAEKDLAHELHLPSKEVLKTYIATDVPAYSKGQFSDEKRWTLFTQALNLPNNLVPLCIDEFYKSYHLFPETFQFLKKLKQENQYRLGVLSDQPTVVAKYIQATYTNVFSIFDPSLIIISAEVELSKKDPDLKIYQFAIEKAEVSKDEILFVDNSENNIKNASSLGINTFFFDIKSKSLSSLLNDLQKRLANK